MVKEGKGRLFKRKDNKFLIYVPKDLAEDSMFPFKVENSMSVKISFESDAKRVIIEEWEE